MSTQEGRTLNINFKGAPSNQAAQDEERKNELQETVIASS